ncbi:arginine deiminase family protein [Candidatus Aminicenantes bacterium AC-334-K16]|jgi:dimethylargininase|nr:arginine deiminase family protein [Candidatus Aminicenantes bacterium AC-334-K16]
MVRSEGEVLRQVIVCSPEEEYFQVNNLEAHNIEHVADRQLAPRQHLALRETMHRAGAKIINMPELKGHPNSVFTRDTSLVIPNGFIRLRMGLLSRQGEEDWMARALTDLGLEERGRIQPPGTVEGGDVILAGDVAFIGLSCRSNQEGVDQLREILLRAGFKVRIIPVPPPHLHLGGMMSLVSPEDIICTTEIYSPDYFSGFQVHLLPVRGAISANVICLGPGEVVVEASNLAAAEKLDQAGFRLHQLDLSEFVKGRGGPTCLILPVERG